MQYDLLNVTISQVRRFNTSLTKSGAVTYNKGDTPSISNIDPADAGTGGGKTVSDKICYLIPVCTDLSFRSPLFLNVSSFLEPVVA